MNEAQRIQKAAAGDNDAFGELVTQHMRRAYYVALGLVGNPETALDLSQDAFARAFRARKSLDPSRPFYPWLYQILRRLCFNFNRDRRTRAERLEAAGDWLAEEAAARVSNGDPAATVERAELRTRVREALESLSDRDREALVLKEFEGLRYREIAELLGIPIGTVMSRLYAARRRLADAIREDH